MKVAQKPSDKRGMRLRNADLNFMRQDLRFTLLSLVCAPSPFSIFQKERQRRE